MKKVLVCILILAGFLRFIGIYPGYSQYHTDEPIIYQNAVNLVKNVNYQSLRFDYGLLPSLINTFFYKVVFIPFLWCKFYLQNAGDIFTGLIRFPLGKDVYERVATRLKTILESTTTKERSRMLTKEKRWEPMVHCFPRNHTYIKVHFS